MTKPPIKAFWKNSTAGGQATMVDTPGRCRDLDYCSIGQMRTLVSVPLGQAFVCPECGKPLRPPAMINQPLSRKRLAVWSVGTLGLFVLLYECMAPSAPKHHLDLAALQQQQQARLAAAARPAPAPVTSPPLTPPAPTPPPVAQLAPTPEPKPAAPPTVAGPPTSPPAATPGTRVTMECSIDAAGVPSNCTAVRDHEQPMPPPQPAPKPELPPPAPADSDASTVPVAGGMPSYPSDYVRDGRFGEVSVTCLILSTGEAQHCRVHDYIGGRRFAEAVANWLNTGQVRFKPAMHDGQPVAQERHWHIAFPPR